MRKEEYSLILVVSVIFFILSIIVIKSSLAAVPTQVEVDSSNNIPPILNLTIPNQIWASNTNLIDAFDLDDYFTDLERLTYTASSVTNISIVIDPNTNLVSFYPNSNFTGIRTVVFTAYDTFSSTNSNTVTLNVTRDTQPPSWSNIARDKASISQNTLVTFTADWTDNFALSHYIFSISQGGIWANSSPVSFSGIQNTSTQAIQVSAAPSSNVEWKFFAYDTSGNMNATLTQSFTVTAQEAIPPPEPSGGSLTTRRTEAKKKTIKEIFTSNPAFSISPEGPIKIEMKQGDSSTISFKIINTGNVDLSFLLDTYGLEDFSPIISHKSFNLSSGKSTSIVIEFKANKRQRPDLYYGGATFTSSIGVKKIPIIITLNPIESKLGIGVDIYPESKRIYPNRPLRANITLTSLGDFIVQNISLYSAITDYEGKIYNSETEEIEFKKTPLTLEKEFNISADIVPGEYLFISRAVTEDDVALDSDTFEVLERFNVRGFIKTNFILFSIILLAGFMIIFLMRYQRSKNRLRVLNLYLLVSELNKLMKKGKMDEAINLYIRIKSSYGEPVASTTLQNKNQLKQEIEALVLKLNTQKSLEGEAVIVIKSEEKKESAAPQENKEEAVAKKTHKEILSHLKEVHNEALPLSQEKEINIETKEKKDEEKKEETPVEVKKEEKKEDKPKEETKAEDKKDEKTN